MGAENVLLFFALRLEIIIISTVSSESLASRAATFSMRSVISGSSLASNVSNLPNSSANLD